MVSLVALVVPIVVAAVFVFVASSLVHMVLGYHRSDYKRLDKEDEVLTALRGAGVTPGFYNFPYCASPKEMGEPATVAKFEKGPVGHLTIIPSGRMNMGKYLGTWFVYCLVVSFFTAYLASRTIGADTGTDYLHVFRIVGATAFMAYGLGPVVNSIWMGQPWGNTIKHVFDGLIFSLVTAGTFGWLWPH
jgi:hypothetical protein